MRLVFSVFIVSVMLGAAGLSVTLFLFQLGVFTLD